MNFTHKNIELGYDDLITNTQSTGRTYYSPNGKGYPSITTVLSILSKDAIAEWKSRIGEKEANRIGHHAGTRGTYVHEIIEKYLKNEPTTGYMPHINGSLSKMKPYLDDIDEIYGMEIPLYSDHLGIAGRCDCIAKYKGRMAIFDWKTSMKKKKKEWIHAYFMQCAGYAIMYEERTGIPVKDLIVLIDVDGPIKPQLFIEDRDVWAGPLIETIAKYKEQQYG